MLTLANNPVLRSLLPKCWPKRQYKSRGAADAGARSLLRRGLEKNADLLHSYECPFCRHWHTGHGHGGDDRGR